MPDEKQQPLRKMPYRYLRESGAETIKILKIAISDLLYLLPECSRCFYLKAHGLLDRPRTPFPKIFSAIDRAIKEALNGVRTEYLAIGMPKGAICADGWWVRSDSLSTPGISACFSLRGRLDLLIELDAGGFGIVRVATSRQSEEFVHLRSLELHGLAWCVENPSSATALPAGSVSELGILTFEPGGFLLGNVAGGNLVGNLKWTAVERDQRWFGRRMDEVATLLDHEAPPPPDPDCMWCRHVVMANSLIG
jgi:hypothetical protein